MNRKTCVCVVHALGVQFKCNTFIGYIDHFYFFLNNIFFWGWGSNLFQQYDLILLQINRTSKRKVNDIIVVFSSPENNRIC